MQRTLRLYLLRWHRRVGVVIVLFLLMLVVTGVLLNHSSGLALDQRPVKQAWLLEHYGIHTPEITGYQVGQQWLVKAGASQLFLDLQPLSKCASRLVGAALQGELLVVACAQELLLFTASGQLVERITDAQGLPVPVTALAANNDGLYVQSVDSVLQVEPDTLNWSPVDTLRQIVWIEASSVPASVQSGITRAYQGAGLSLERVLLDLHSGRLFGHWGVYIVDLVALLLAVTSLAGLWVWLTKPGRFRT